MRIKSTDEVQIAISSFEKQIAMLTGQLKNYDSVLLEIKELERKIEEDQKHLNQIILKYDALLEKKEKLEKHNEKTGWFKSKS